MTADSQWVVQQAIYTALAADATLTALVPAARILGHIPQDTTFPYISIAESSALEWDTKDSDGMDQTVTIHIWDRWDADGDPRGVSGIKQIMSAIIDVLDKSSLSITGHDLVLFRFEFSNIMLDPDGLTRHGVQRYRIVTDSQ